MALTKVAFDALANGVPFSIKVDMAPNSKQDCVAVEKDKPCTANGNRERSLDRYNNYLSIVALFKSYSLLQKTFFPSDNAKYKKTFPMMIMMTTTTIMITTLIVINMSMLMRIDSIIEMSISKM